MGKRIAGGQFHCALQRCASWFELAFGPFEKSQIAIGIFEERIQANRFEILGGSLAILAQLGKHDPAKIANACVVRALTFRNSELRRQRQADSLSAPRDPSEMHLF